MTAQFLPGVALCTLRYSELYQRHTYLDRQMTNERLREHTLKQNLEHLESRLAGRTTNEGIESRKNLRNQIRSLKFRLRRCSAVVETLHVGLTEVSNQMQTLEQQQWEKTLDPYTEHRTLSQTGPTAVLARESTIRASPAQAGSTEPIPNQGGWSFTQVADEAMRNEATSHVIRRLGPDDAAWMVHSERLALLADSSDSESICDGSVSELELALSLKANDPTVCPRGTTNIMSSNGDSNAPPGG